MSGFRQWAVTIGRTRLYVLLGLLAAALALAGLWQKYLLPQQAALQAESGMLTHEQSRLSKDITELPSKYEKLAASEARYKALIAEGFIGNQDRIAARVRMDYLRAAVGLRGVEYDIQPLLKLDQDELQASDKELVRSSINVSFKGLSDLEMRDFVEQMRHAFGGLIVVNGLSFERAEPLNQENLVKLGQSQPVDFVTGKANFDWYTLVPKADMAAPVAAQAFGGATPQ